MTTLSSYNQYRRTDSADVEAHHIKSGKIAYGAAGQLVGNAYTPAMMKYDGSTGYYARTHTTSGNKETVVIRFNIPSFTGGGTQRLLDHRGDLNTFRCMLMAWSSDHATVDRRSKIGVITQNSAGTQICFLLSETALCDGENHTVYYEFDGDLGTAEFIVDSVDEDDTLNAERVAPTTGTLDSGSSSELGVGAFYSGTGFVNGELGFVGVDDSVGLDSADFMHTDGSPKQLDESTWTEWGAQPLFWNEHGQMDNNLGSAGNMTRNGTIVVGKGGNT